MFGVRPKDFAVQPIGENKDPEPKEFSAPTSADVPVRKRKPRHKKFIDLQKQPPKPKPLIQE
jgi:hypothetical protein